MVRDLRYQSSASSSRPRCWAVYAELVVGACQAGSVAEFLVDGEGFAVPVLGFVELPAVLGGDAELVVGAGQAGSVAEFLVDGEGFAVPVLGLVELPSVLGGHAELVVDDGDVPAGPVGFRLVSQVGEDLPVGQRGLVWLPGFVLPVACLTAVYSHRERASSAGC